MKAQDYPFAQELITDNDGNICKVILNYRDYQHLIELVEDEGLYRAMIEAKPEKTLSLAEALKELKRE